MYPSALGQDKAQDVYHSVVEFEGLVQSLRPTAVDTGFVEEGTRCHRMGVLTADKMEMGSRYQFDQSIADSAEEKGGQCYMPPA